MNSDSFRTAFHAARELQAAGRLPEAEVAYRKLLAQGPDREPVLHALADLYLQANQPKPAAEALFALTREAPGQLLYCAKLAGLLDSLGQTEAAIDQYQDFIRRQPSNPDAQFNLALLYKSTFRYRNAVAAYESAIRLGVRNVKEVYSNLGVVYSEMRNPEKAREMYNKALSVDPNYVPALFNLAGLHEELGDRNESAGLHRKILALKPDHYDSLARLAYAGKIDDPNDPLIKRIEKAIPAAADKPLAQEGLLFALGKALDDCAEYQRAFDAYRQANELGRRRNPRYDRAAITRGFDKLIALFDAAWLQRSQTEGTEAPVFICGMFRSGSTLVEQMLGRHPALTAAGELDFMPWLISRRLKPYPHRAATVSSRELGEIAAEYTALVGALFPDAERITDKRPDNFLHMALIRAMWPSARFVYTKRNAADNCLSIFFQQFGGDLSYATDLDDCAHYYGQHERLVNHWRDLFGDGIFTVDYDALVREPEPILRELLGFLGLDWHAQCLDFRSSAAAVKTASVWQVREGLHRGSSGRISHYQPFIDRYRSS